MENKCDLYTSKDISRFIDGELSSEKRRSIEHHLSICTDCNRLVDSYESVSLVFSRHADRQSMGSSVILGLERRLEKTVLHSQEKPSGKISGLFGKNIYLKLASILAVLMIGLFPFDEDLLNDSSGPSAIVNSIDAEYTSVMIIETQEEKHTIIWFSEET
jgi:Putative zinc-finger